MGFIALLLLVAGGGLLGWFYSRSVRKMATKWVYEMTRNGS